MKQRPALDFARAQPDFERSRAYRLAACFLLAGLSLGLLGWSYQDLQAQRQELQAARVRLLAAPTAPVAARWTVAEDSAVRNMLTQLAVPWDALFAALEQARGDLVTVNALRCDGAERPVLVTARASDFAAASEFVDRLAALPLLTSVTLLQSDNAIQPAGAGVVFSVSARWKETAP